MLISRDRKAIGHNFSSKSSTFWRAVSVRNKYKNIIIIPVNKCYCIGTYGVGALENREKKNQLCQSQDRENSQTEFSILRGAS